MKVRIKTVKIESTAPRDFFIPQDVLDEGGEAVSAWIGRCTHIYRFENFKTVATLVDVGKEKIEAAAAGLRGTGEGAAEEEMTND